MSYPYPNESNTDLALIAAQIASGSNSLFQNRQRDVAEDVKTLAALVAELFRRLPSGLEDTAGDP